MDIVAKAFHVQALCSVELLVADVIGIVAFQVYSAVLFVAAILTVDISITPILRRDTLGPRGTAPFLARAMYVAITLGLV